MKWRANIVAALNILKLEFLEFEMQNQSAMKKLKDNYTEEVDLTSLTL